MKNDVAMKKSQNNEGLVKQENKGIVGDLKKIVANKKRELHSELALKEIGKEILRDIAKDAEQSIIENSERVRNGDITLEEAKSNIVKDVSKSSKARLYGKGKEVSAGIGAYLGREVGRAIGAVFGEAEIGGAIAEVVGSIIFSKGFEIAVTHGYPLAKELAEKAKSDAMVVIGIVRNEAPEKVEILRNSFNDFWKKRSIPISV
ncbi:MAG: hypothetical protein IKI30_01850 [Oxalobacter sp.]|nr:hypothetical protein [Oxalobacter sp.]